MASQMMELKIVSLGKTYGPVQLEMLVRLAATGRISADDLVRQRGEQAWRRVTDIPALAACLQQTSAVGKDLEDLGGGSARPAPCRRRPAEDAEMDMTPMIDVTFQLLIFFMLSHTWANLAAMEVPTAVHGRGVNMEGQQVILIDRDGAYYVGERPDPGFRHDSVDSLIKEVQANASHMGDKPLDVIIHGHKQSKHKCLRDIIAGLGGVSGVGKILCGVQEKYQ